MPELFRGLESEDSPCYSHGTRVDRYPLPSLFCLHEAFVFIDTEAMRETYLRLIVDRTSTAGCELKLLLVLHGSPHRRSATASTSKNVRVATLQSATPLPSHSRHRTCRSGSLGEGWKMQRLKGRTQSRVRVMYRGRPRAVSCQATSRH